VDEVVVVGGGIAGLSAALHAAQSGRFVTVLENAAAHGGQIATVGHVEGLPIPGVFSGQDLVTHYLGQCRNLGVVFTEAEVLRLEAGKATLRIDTASGVSLHPKSVIVASGARLRELGIPGESEFLGRGVSRCATCDGLFFRDKVVVVIGGGDSACQEATVLARTCGRVIVVARSALRARRDCIEKLAGLENVSFIWDSAVERITGTDGVDGVVLRHRVTGQSSEVACAGVFPFVGTLPNTGYLPRRILDAGQFVACDAHGATALPGVFAAGAVRAGYGGYLAQAQADGLAAAQSAHSYLQQQAAAAAKASSPGTRAAALPL